MPRPILRRTLAIDTTQPIGFWRQTFSALNLMLGAGVFVGMGIAINVAGVGIMGAVTVAALLALVNQGSVAQPSARAAASFSADRLIDSEAPVYTDWQYFTADWMLFLARLTAVATAALGIAGYWLQGFWLVDPIWLMPTALLVVVALTIISFRGLIPRKGAELMATLAVLLAMIALLGLIFAGLPETPRLNLQNLGWLPWRAERSLGLLAPVANFLQAVALMSAAYASDPHPSQTTTQTSSKAARFALVLAWLLYLGVVGVGLRALESLPNRHSDPTTVLMAPWVNVMQNLPLPGGVYLVALGAVAAMAAMALHLLPKLVDGLLELSCSPTVFSRRQPSESPLSPRLAKLLISSALGGIVFVGDVKTIWSFSAFAFLLHAALMHRIAVRQSSAQTPCWRHRLGFAACLFLAFWVNWDVWLVGLGLVALALIWRGVQYWSEEP